MGCLLVVFLPAFILHSLYQTLIYIIFSNSNYFRYIDDILLICPQEIYVMKIIDGLNNREATIKFPDELETNNSLPVLDFLLLRNHPDLELKVYRKPTCENDH